MSPATVAHLADPISSGSGPGLFLQIIVVAAIVGVLLFVWLLARANRDN